MRTRRVTDAVVLGFSDGQGPLPGFPHNVSARSQEHWNAEDEAAAVGKRKEREEAVRLGGQKRMRQHTITESFSSQWQMKFKKKFLRFVYSQHLAFNVFRSEPWKDFVRHFRELLGPVKVLWSSHNEIVDMDMVAHTADDVAGDLAEVRAPFYVTGATIMSDGRKSRDARPIVNFLAGGSRGVMMVRTMNREGERDQAEVEDSTDHVAAVRGACLQQNVVRYWLVKPVVEGHYCAWESGGALHQGARRRSLHLQGESKQMGLVYPCETRFASVFAMMERLLAVRSALERMVDDDGWGLVPWDSSVAQLAWWVRWQVRHGPWWDSMGVLIRIIELVYDMLRRLDRGGLHMSRVVQWTQDVAHDVAREVRALPSGVAQFIMQKVQARCAHMLKPAHAAAHLLCPSRRDLRYYEGVVSDYDRIVQEVETYIRTQTGFSCAPQLQAIALRVMYMWTCSSPAKRNRAIHEAVHMKKRNKLEFEKVAKLVEISANVRLLSHQRAGRGFALPWTGDESMLDIEGGIGTQPSWQGTDPSRSQEDRERQIRSWIRDPCGSRASPGEVGDVFGTRAATLRPYPRDDDSGDEGAKGLEERAGAADHPAGGPGETNEWNDPEEVCRRSGGDDLFGGGDGSPFEQERPSCPGPQSVDTQAAHDSACSRRAKSACGGGIAGHHPGRLRSGMASSGVVPPPSGKLHRGSPPRGRLHKLVKGPRQRLEERLVGGPSPTERVERVVERPTGRRTPPFGGDGRSPIQEAVETEGVGGGGDDRVSMGGGEGFSQFGDLGPPHGDCDSRGDPETFTSAMHGELGASPAEIERDEEATPPGETSTKRLDRLDSRRACLLTRADPRTQELACLATEERQRQLGTFRGLPPDAQAARHVGPMTEVRYEIQAEAPVLQPASAGTEGEAAAGPGTSAELHGEAAGGGDGRAETGGGTIAGVQGEAEGLHATALTTPGDPVSHFVQSGHFRRPERPVHVGYSLGTRGHRSFEGSPSGRNVGVETDTKQGLGTHRRVGTPRPPTPGPVPDQPLHNGQRTEDALPETEEIPPGLEDIQTGQPMGVDDDAPLAWAGTISPTTGVGEDVGGDAVVGGVEERVHADPVSLVEGGRHTLDDGGAGARQEAIGTLDRGRHEVSRSLVVRTAVGPIVRHEAPFPIDPMRPAGGVTSIAERRVGRGMCAPPIPPFAPSTKRTQSRYAPHPRGTLPFGCMTAEELKALGTMDYTGIDTGQPDLSWAPASPSLASGGSIAVPSHGGAGPLSRGSADVQPRGSHTPRSATHRQRDTSDHGRDTMLFDCTDQPWSETRRVTSTSAGRQPGLRGVSSSAGRRDVAASGFGNRGGDSGDIYGGREGARDGDAEAVQRPLTYGLREASIILEEPEVGQRARQARHVPIDRLQKGETSGADGLPMRRESRRHVDLATAGVKPSRGRRVIMDNNPPKPSHAGRREQPRRGRLRGSGGTHGRASHQSAQSSPSNEDP
ncbi:hypothetical protein CBR_g45797 [Chara braunii]|uniref:Uncharacterized protein n=1 Tax=Chara braunii TaxID=69332 RepID=A0A388LZ93_CHABU|nr:hypothetical protein CBR_g45797 [Chara braunii]|eukprot:GBG87644.1 hypothetical protein CBR_g45797 [Chara braunii]